MSVSKTALADIGGDLLVREPHRHGTADLSKAKLSAVGHCCAVGLVSLLCKKCCQTFVEDSGCLAHSSTCCETSGVKESLSTSRTLQ